MRNGSAKQFFWFFFLSILLTISARAGDKEKKKYEISEMPQALYLANPDSKDATLEFSIVACPALAPKSNTAYGYLETLTSAGERRSGSQDLRCAVESVRKVLAGFGYQVTVQSYRFPYYQVEDSLYLIQEKDTGKIYPSFPLMYSPETEPMVSGKVKRPANFEKGDLVLVQGNMLSRKSLAQQAKDWQKQGAIGLVLDPEMFPFNPEGLPFPRSIHSTSYHYGALPGIIVQDAKKLIGKEVTLKSQCGIYAGRGYNVIAQTPGEFENYILIGGHLDSWFQGALDDGSGVAMMMRIAELLKDEKPGKTGFIFAAFDGEELGLFGSGYFYEKFGAEKIKAMLNLDMVSVKNNYFYKDPAQAGIMPKVISVSPELKDLTRATFSRIKVAKLYTGLQWWRSFYGSLPTDYEWFYAAGVPGVFIYTPDKYYHTVKDDLTWMDADDLESVSQAGAQLVLKMAGMDIPRPKDPLEMEFFMLRQDDGSLAFDLNLKKGDQNHLRAKPLVYCYYERGFEKKITLKRGQGGKYRGSFAPLYRGEYQFLAVAEVGEESRKQIKSMTIEDPVKEEKKESEKDSQKGGNEKWKK